MTHVFPRRSRRTSLRAAAFIAAGLVAIPLASAALAADSAAAVPVPSPTASTIAEVARSSIYGQTNNGQYLQGGDVDPARDRLYLGDLQQDGTPGLSVLDLESGTASTIPLAGEFNAIDVAVSPVGGTVYVVHNTPAGVVSVVDPAADYTASELPPTVAVGGNPQKVEIGADGRAYVINLDGGTISILGRADGADRLNVVQTLSSVATVAAITAIDNQRDLLFVASETSKTVTVIDTAAATATVVGAFSVTHTPSGITVDARTGEVVIATQDNNTVSWFSSNDDWATVAIGRTESLATLADTDTLLPLSVTVRPDGTTLVVTQVFPDDLKSFVSVIPEDGGAVRTIPVGNVAFWGVQDPQPGGSLYVPNSGNGTVSVIADVTLTAVASSVSFGQETQAQATVVRADGYPLAASIAFTDSAHDPLGSATVDGSGKATLNLGKQAVGSSPFTATVVSPATVTLSAAGVATTIKASTSTTVAITPEHLIEGGTASVAISVAGSYGTVPSGTVTLKKGADVVGSATLVSGSAMVELSALVAGSSQLVATYSGDASHEAGVSESFTLTVAMRTATGVVNNATAQVGGTLTINLSGFAPHETVNLTLHSDPIALGSVRVDGAGAGAFTFTVPQVAAGKHAVVAVGASSGRTTSTDVTITAKGALATTGTSGLEFGLTSGFVALLLGFAMVMWRRHSRRTVNS